jgi:hypothetical protein
MVIPWDLDLTWADHMYGNGMEPFYAPVTFKPALGLEYRNRLREIRDLLFNPEQTDRIIYEYASVIWEPNAQATVVEADRRKWDWHPWMARGSAAGQGKFYEAVPTRDFAGMVKQMKGYVKTRGQWIDGALLNDPKIPATPKITRGERLRFVASPYKGENAFAAVKWRIAEVSDKAPRIYEITPVWESEELAKNEPVTIPEKVVAVGKTYRVRARMKDASGRWSHWSAPIEFVGEK